MGGGFGGKDDTAAIVCARTALAALAHGPAGQDDLRPRMVDARELQAPSLPRALPHGRRRRRPDPGRALPHRRRRRRLLLGLALGDLALDRAVLRPLRRAERRRRSVERLHQQRLHRRHARLRLAAGELRRRTAGRDGGREGGPVRRRIPPAEHGPPGKHDRHRPGPRRPRRQPVRGPRPRAGRERLRGEARRARRAARARTTSTASAWP